MGSEMCIRDSFTVDKVLFERQKAVGVTVVAENTSKQIMAAKEVILSAGAINSPQILLRSGIGPKEDLEAKGINIIQNPAKKTALRPSESVT